MYITGIGVAAANNGGITVHQFAGLSQLATSEQLSDTAIMNSVSSATTVVRRWREAQVLIIDEISMMSPYLLYVCPRI